MFYHQVQKLQSLRKKLWKREEMWSHPTYFLVRWAEKLDYRHPKILKDFSKFTNYIHFISFSQKLTLGSCVTSSWFRGNKSAFTLNINKQRNNIFAPIKLSFDGIFELFIEILHFVFRRSFRTFKIFMTLHVVNT